MHARHNLATHATLVKREDKNTKAVFPIAGEAFEAISYSTPGLKEGTLDSSVFSVEGSQIFHLQENLGATYK